MGAHQIHGDHEPTFTEVIQFGSISWAFEMLTRVLGDGGEGDQRLGVSRNMESPIFV